MFWSGRSSQSSQGWHKKCNPVMAGSVINNTQTVRQSPALAGEHHLSEMFLKCFILHKPSCSAQIDVYLWRLFSVLWKSLNVKAGIPTTRLLRLRYDQLGIITSTLFNILFNILFLGLKWKILKIQSQFQFYFNKESVNFPEFYIKSIEEKLVWAVTSG